MSTRPLFVGERPSVWPTAGPSTFRLERICTDASKIQEKSTVCVDECALSSNMGTMLHATQALLGAHRSPSPMLLTSMHANSVTRKTFYQHFILSVSRVLAKVLPHRLYNVADKHITLDEELGIGFYTRVLNGMYGREVDDTTRETRDT